jgi:sterol 24-C-methyltransferase
MIPAINDDDPNLKRVMRYYDRTESRIGYLYFLHGTKHFGWYEPGQSKWQFTRAMRRMEDELGKRLDLPADAEVLDAGCGMGDVARTMATKYRLKVTGIDILDFNIDEARKRSTSSGLGDRTKFQLGDYHRLDFRDETFDGVYTMETLVHASDPEKVLSEFRRVLRPGGHLVMFEYSHAPESELSPAALKAFRQVCDLGAMPTWQRLEHGGMEPLLKEEGFGLDSAEDTSRRILPMLHAFYLFGRFPYFVGRAAHRVPNVVNAMSGVEMWRHREIWRYNMYVAHKPGCPWRRLPELPRS